MRYSDRLLAICVLLVLGIALVAAQADTITILYFGDTHSALAPLGPRTATLGGQQGGIARAATLVGYNKMTEPNVLTLHAGDFFIGDVFFNMYFGVPELRLMSAISFDAMAVGNHEFDLTPTALQQALDTAFLAIPQFPLLSANAVLDSPTAQGLRRYIKPYFIKQFGTTKVGVFGMTTSSTNVLSQPSPVFIDTNIVQIAASLVDTLIAQNCNLIICLSHLGLRLDKVVANNVSGIHAIIGGHDHCLLDQPIPGLNPAGDTTWICQASAFYCNMGKLKFGVGSTGARLLTKQTIPINCTVPADTNVAAIVSGLIAGIEATYGPLYTKQITTVTGYLEEVADSLQYPGYHDTPVGNIVTDAFRFTMGTQIGIEPGGSTAQPFYQGPIVAADAFRVVGYGFNTTNRLGYRMATFEMTGANLRAGLEFGLSDLEGDDENLIQVSGMTYSYDATRPPFSRIDSARIGNAPLDPNATYTIATNEFVPLMLRFVGIPYSNLHVFSGDTTEFQVLSAYIGRLDTMSPQAGNRIQCVAGVPGLKGSVDGTPTEPKFEQRYLSSKQGCSPDSMQTGLLQTVEPKIDPLPIVSYDTDTGLGYGAKVFFLNQFGRHESIDFTAFNSTKGERWYRLVFSIPDFELRQGKVCPLAVDLTIDYDKWIANSFFGIGNHSRFDDREFFTKEPLEIGLSLSHGFSVHSIGQCGIRFKTIRIYGFDASGCLQQLSPELRPSRVTYSSLVLGYRHDTRTSHVNPSSGLLAQAELELCPNVGMNDVSFTRIGSTIQWYAETGLLRSIIAGRLGMQALNSSIQLPVQTLLSIGGNNTVRGSVQDRYLDMVSCLANIELRFPVYWRFGGVVGADAGKVWSRVSEIDIVGWAVNPVAGLRFYMDTFVVRLDIGFGSETTGFYLNFGHLF